MIICISFWNGANVFGQEKNSLASHVIHEIPANGIVINEPGTYVFEKNLTWNPNSEGVAIFIKANDVTLDMQGYTLKFTFSDFKTIGISAILSSNLHRCFHQKRRGRWA